MPERYARLKLLENEIILIRERAAALGLALSDRLLSMTLLDVAAAIAEARGRDRR